MDKIPMTQPGFDKLEEELKHLKTVERPSVIAAISEAREHGDLSENAEYSAAKEKQGFIEGRIAELQAKLSRAQIIDTSTFTGDTIKFGATVTLEDEDTGEETTYRIVGEEEADIQSGLISINAPLARALINKNKRDSVEVTTPRGSKFYEIVRIAYNKF